MPPKKHPPQRDALGPCQASMTEPFAKIVNDFLFLYPMKTLENQRFPDVYRGYRNGKPFTFFIKSSLIDVWQGFRNLEFVIAFVFQISSPYAQI